MNCTYHYCLMQQRPDGNLTYFHGAVELGRPVETLKDFTDTIEELCKRNGLLPKDTIVLALNRL